MGNIQPASWPTSIIKTHFHYYHTGGNENFGATATITSGEALLRKKPIYIGYDPHRTYDTPINMKPFSPEHASLIVGKAKCSKNDGRSTAYYILRNSFGKSLCE